MSFREGAWAKVWEIKPVRENITTLRISTSRKDKQTGEYETDFSGFVTCIGTNVAGKAARLNEGDRIKIGHCDVTTKYDKEKRITYTNFNMFSFDNNEDDEDVTQSTVDDGEVEGKSQKELPY